ncbi:efflux RND transporter periplasmic adaptor subunit [Thermosulfurimonas dismutans]|uniref:Multidrug resistance protein MdtA-like C-terminal permuted SH3 domain-containing protein n=1 Tax=Thermosulfurimonas dismutans TaxID=999894 RepID=A0A179D6A2_9BACT|nr:efflux RND transporter periplasmic adaptor subunit [Thermosulfurimonas dismutans]OAQ21138.1 hypothetical protein TDIS_0790 [Thermosulfurimonas dismutans]
MKKRGLLQALAASLILAMGLGISYHLISSRPKPPAKRREKPVLVVKTVEVKPQAFTYTVETTGTVVAPRQIELSAEVSGKIIYVSPKLLPGEVVLEDEVLIKIDPTDYEAAVVRAEAELKQAERVLAELSAEAERSVAEWRALHPESPPPPLVAKKPQLAEARAAVSAARAALKKARTDLKRTEIRAPYKARVLEVHAEVGSYASPGRILAVLYPLSGLEIYAPVADHFLPYIAVPGLNAPAKAPGSPAEIFWEAGEAVFRYPGRIIRAAGAVEEKTRLLPLYLRAKESSQTPPLLPGVFVTVRILGRSFPEVFILPKEALNRDLGETFVWVVNSEERLERRPVKVLYEDEKRVVVTEGLSAGEKVVAQRLRGAVSGMLVRER